MSKSENFACFAFSETWRHLGIAQTSLALLSVCTSFPCEDLLSRCFHFGVSEIIVSSLFILRFYNSNSNWLSGIYKKTADFQEEYYD